MIWCINRSTDWFIITNDTNVKSCANGVCMRACVHAYCIVFIIDSEWSFFMCVFVACSGLKLISLCYEKYKLQKQAFNWGSSVSKLTNQRLDEKVSHMFRDFIFTTMFRPLVSAEFKNAWSSISTPTYVFIVWCLSRMTDLSVLQRTLAYFRHFATQIHKSAVLYMYMVLLIINTTPFLNLKVVGNSLPVVSQQNFQTDGKDLNP
jgi:hypothetical protein